MSHETERAAKRHSYLKYRKRGWTASHAWRAAQIDLEWEFAEDLGLVKTEMIPDEEMYDDSYLETWGLSPARLKRAKKDLWALIERDGVWGLVTYWRPFDGATWRQGGSVWGCVGSNPREHAAYWSDLKREALDALDSENEEIADRDYTFRPTYAGTP